MSKKVYICGKMTGIEDYNRPKFNKVAKQFAMTGVDVFNPADIVGDKSWDWSNYMREAIKGMLDCTDVYVLEGYESSRGANIEIDLAVDIGMDITYEKSESKVI